MKWLDVYENENIEYVPLGIFWSSDWEVPEDKLYAKIIGRDRLELLRKSTYNSSEIIVDSNLYELAENVLIDAELQQTEYWIDNELQEYEIPYAYFNVQSHREALRKVAEACIGQIYCDRNGIIRIEGASFLEDKNNIDLTINEYFTKGNPSKIENLANYIEIETQPLSPDIEQEVYRSDETIISANGTKALTIFFNESPCLDPYIEFEEESGDITIDDIKYYSWGARVTLTSTVASSCIIVAYAKPLKVLNKDKIIAKDNQSIRDNGVLKYNYPANNLVQTKEMAQKIANKLLEYYKNPKRDIEMDWRGNPALELGDKIKTPDYKSDMGEFYVTKQELIYSGALRARLEGRRA